MRMPRLRITIGRMMVAVAIGALVSAIAIEIPPTIIPFMNDRNIWFGARSHNVVVILLTGVLTCVIVVPLIAAVGLFLDVVSKTWTERRLPVRRLLSAIVLLGIGLAIILRPLPVDGMKQAHQVNSGTWVTFYHQYRFWPGRHVTPCVELYELDGRQQIYPINVATSFGNVDFRFNADRTIVWFVDTRPMARSRGVICSLNLNTGEFISTPGPFPAGVSEK